MFKTQCIVKLRLFSLASKNGKLMMNELQNEISEAIGFVQKITKLVNQFKKKKQNLFKFTDSALEIPMAQHKTTLSILALKDLAFPGGDAQLHGRNE